MPQPESSWPAKVREPSGLAIIKRRAGGTQGSPIKRSKLQQLPFLGGQRWSQSKKTADDCLGQPSRRIVQPPSCWFIRGKDCGLRYQSLCPCGALYGVLCTMLLKSWLGLGPGWVGLLGRVWVHKGSWDIFNGGNWPSKKRKETRRRHGVADISRCFCSSRSLTLSSVFLLF